MGGNQPLSSWEVGRWGDAREGMGHPTVSLNWGWLREAISGRARLGWGLGGLWVLFPGLQPEPAFPVTAGPGGHRPYSRDFLPSVVLSGRS